MKFKKKRSFSREVGLKQPPLKKASKLPIKKDFFFKNEWNLVFLKLRTCKNFKFNLVCINKTNVVANVE